MTARQLLLAFALPVLTSNLVLAEAQCPAGITPVRYHSLGLSQIGISVAINHSGPYEFLVDTGAPLTMMEPSLAEELQLTPQASIGVISVANYAKAQLVIPDAIDAGTVSVSKPLVAVEGLGQIHANNPQVRGILGLNFLGRFDLLIDYAHKFLCLDEAKQMQAAVRGEHVPVQAQPDRQSDLPYTQPLLLSAHLPGDKAQGTLLRLDSGSNAPVLFSSREEQPAWMLRGRATQGGVTGNGGALSFAATAATEVKIGAHTVRQIAFLAPTSSGRRFDAGGEDGLLPASLFKRVYISYADKFVILDPH